MINYNHLIFANLPRYRFKNINIYKIIVQSYYNETESKSEQLNKNISETMKTTRKRYSNTLNSSIGFQLIFSEKAHQLNPMRISQIKVCAHSTSGCFLFPPTIMLKFSMLTSRCSHRSNFIQEKIVVKTNSELFFELFRNLVDLFTPSSPLCIVDPENYCYSQIFVKLSVLIV